MKSKVISTISAILFLTAIAYFASGVYTENKNGIKKTKARFDTLFENTKEISIKNKVGTQTFRKEFLNKIGDFEDFSEIELSVNDIVVYSYPKSYENYSQPSEKFVKTFKASESITGILPISKTDTQALDDYSELSLYATIYKIKQDSIHNHAKISFILVLAGTILSVLTLFFSNKKKEDNNSKPSYSKSNDDILSEIKSNTQFEKELENINDNSTVIADYNDDYIDDTNDEIINDDIDDDDSDDDEVSFEESIVFNDEKTESQDEKIEEQPIKDEFYEPDFDSTEEAASNIVIEDSYIQDTDLQSEQNIEIETTEEVTSTEESLNEDYALTEDTQENNFVDTEPELSNENTESISEPVFQEEEEQNKNEQIDENFENIISSENGFDTNNSSEFDSINQEIASSNTFVKDLGGQLKENQYIEISLALIKITNFDWESEKCIDMANEIISIIKHNFGEDSETYKYNENTISIVLNGSDIDKTITYCETILPVLTEILSTDTEEHKIHIGISAMNYRAIPADRLIVEAKGALEKAEEDPYNPIVAFKANPDQYKKEIGNELTE